MLLLFDVGNTNICITTYKDGILDESMIRITTLLNRSSDEYYLILKEMLNLNEVTAVAISSVVPDITIALKELSVKHLNINPLIVGPGVKTGVGIIADNPREVGADLICDVAGVLVGHSTVETDNVHTGITAILPHNKNMFKEKVVSACYSYNGFGKSMGLVQVEELGSEVSTVQRPVNQPQVAKPSPRPSTPKPVQQSNPTTSGGSINAPMPGTISDVKVNVGDSVKKGQVLLILEAMKMENEIFAPNDGTVKAVNISKGASVSVGDVLITLG